MIAHELAHVVNRDAAVMTVVGGPGEALLAGGVRVAGQGWYPLMFGGALAAAIGWLGTLGTRALSRYREFAADAGAVALTGNPAALATALMKVSDGLVAIPKRDLRAAAVRDAFHLLPAERGATRSGSRRRTRRCGARIERLERLERALLQQPTNASARGVRHPPRVSAAGAPPRAHAPGRVPARPPAAAPGRERHKARERLERDVDARAGAARAPPAPRCRTSAIPRSCRVARAATTCWPRSATTRSWSSPARPARARRRSCRRSASSSAAASAGTIAHTQPRRLAARTVAERIADELKRAAGRRGRLRGALQRPVTRGHAAAAHDRRPAAGRDPAATGCCAATTRSSSTRRTSAASTSTSCSAT